MSIESLKTTLWMAGGAGIVYFVGCNTLNWKWSDNRYTNGFTFKATLAAVGGAFGLWGQQLWTGFGNKLLKGGRWGEDNGGDGPHPVM